MPVSAKLRPVAILIGGVALFVIVFQVAERVVGPPERSADVTSAEGERAHRADNDQNQRLDPNSMRIEVDGIDTSTVRLSGEDDGSIDDLIECVTAGIQRAEQDGTIDSSPPDGWWARKAEGHRISEQVSRLQNECLGHRLDLPALPPLPPAPVDSALATGTP